MAWNYKIINADNTETDLDDITVKHTASASVGDETKGVFINADGSTSPMAHSVEADVPSTAKFTDTNYSFDQNEEGILILSPES